MSGRELLKEVRARGVDVYTIGEDRIRLRPADRLTPELIETLRVQKHELLEALRAEQRRELQGVGPWSVESLTRRCLSCGGGLQPIGDITEELCGTCRWTMKHLEPKVSGATATRPHDLRHEVAPGGGGLQPRACVGKKKVGLLQRKAMLSDPDICYRETQPCCPEEAANNWGSIPLGGATNE